MKFRAFNDDGTTAASLQSIAAGISTVVAAATGNPYYPGSYPVYPGYVQPGYAVPGTTSGGSAVLPILPMILGGAAGYAWKKSALWGAIGVVAGYFLGNMFGSVAVQGQATSAMLPPSGAGIVRNCPPGMIC